MPSRISNLAGFTTSITSTTNLSAGIITATSFVGNVTGTASTAQGLTGTPNVTVGFATATEFDIYGSSNTFNASGISVGVATATTIRVGTAVTINAGIVSATSFVGSGSSLTGITGKAAAMAIVFGG